MPGQHKAEKAITFWPADEPARQRLLDYAKRTGQAVNAVIRQAVSEFLDRNESTEDHQ